MFDDVDNRREGRGLNDHSHARVEGRPQEMCHRGHDTRARGDPFVLDGPTTAIGHPVGYSFEESGSDGRIPEHPVVRSVGQRSGDFGCSLEVHICKVHGQTAVRRVCPLHGAGSSSVYNGMEVVGQGHSDPYGSAQ